MTVEAAKILHTIVRDFPPSPELVRAFEHLKIAGPEVVCRALRIATAHPSRQREARRLHEEILDYFTELNVECLSSRGVFTEMPLPSLDRSKDVPFPKFTYVARKQFQELYQAVLNMQTTKVEFSGAPSAGKSHVVGAMASFCHSQLAKGAVLQKEPLQAKRENQWVVYVTCSTYAANLVHHLLGALLLTFAGDPNMQGTLLLVDETLEALANFCVMVAARGTLIWFVDEYNYLDHEKDPKTADVPREKRDLAKDHLRRAMGQDFVLFSSSIKSQQVITRVRKGSRKGVEVVELNPPFSETEVALYSAAEHPQGMALGRDDLLQFTGYTPRLVEWYCCAGSIAKFEDTIGPYTNAIDDYFMSISRTEEIEAIRKFLSRAEVSVTDLSKVEVTSFYVDDDHREDVYHHG